MLASPRLGLIVFLSGVSWACRGAPAVEQNNGRAASCVHSMCIGQKLQDQGCCERTFCNSTIFRCAQRKDTSSSNRPLRAGCRAEMAASILHTLLGARLSLTMSTQSASRLGTTLATACTLPCMRALCSHCTSVLQCEDSPLHQRTCPHVQIKHHAQADGKPQFCSSGV